MLRGFSLIEVTVAVAIISIMIVSTGFLLQHIPANGQEARDQDVALKIARSEIESLRAGGYAAIPVSGSFTNTLLGSLASSSASLTVAAFHAQTKRVAASVLWRGNDLVMHSLTLTTLITQNSGLR